MSKTHFLIILLVALTLTACSQVEALLPALEDAILRPTADPGRSYPIRLRLNHPQLRPPRLRPPYSPPPP